MNRNLFAYTPVGVEPPFVSVNEIEPRRVSITVRSPAWVNCKNTGCIELPRSELIGLHTALSAYLNER